MLEIKLYSKRPSTVVTMLFYSIAFAQHNSYSQCCIVAHAQDIAMACIHLSYRVTSHVSVWWNPRTIVGNDAIEVVTTGDYGQIVKLIGSCNIAFAIQWHTDRENKLAKSWKASFNNTKMIERERMRKGKDHIFKCITTFSVITAHFL